MGLAAGIAGIGSALGGALGGIGSAVGGLSGLSSLAGIGSSIYGAVNSANAVNSATNAKTQAAQQYSANFAPYLAGGTSALDAQLALLGLGPGGGGGATPGASSQQSAIDQLKQSPLYQALYHNGEQTVLANAAATGGLRGGNANASLYNLGANTLAQTYQQNFNNLGTITGLGENAAAGVGNGQIYGGNAAYNGILGSADANNNLAKTITGGISNPSLLSALGLSGGINGSSATTMTMANAPAAISSTFDGLF